MKRLIFTFILLFISASLFAQSAESTICDDITISDDSGRRVVSIRPQGDDNALSIIVGGFAIDFSSRSHSQSLSANKAIKRIRKTPQRHISIGDLGFGFNQFSSVNYSAYSSTDRGFLDLNTGKSISLSISLANFHIPLNRRGNMWFDGGLHIKWDNYVFDRQITLDKSGSNVVPIPIGDSFKKSKLATSSFFVPLMLRVNMDKFHFSGGVYGEVLLTSFTKYKKPKHKDNGGYGLNGFQGGLTAKFGYKSYSVFANYGLTEFFRSGRGPQTHLLTMGIAIDF